MGGVIPDSPEELMKSLPGVGKYTAGECEYCHSALLMNGLPCMTLYSYVLLFHQEQWPPLHSIRCEWVPSRHAFK